MTQSNCSIVITFSSFSFSDREKANMSSLEHGTFLGIIEMHPQLH